MDKCWEKTNISLGRPVKLKSLMGVQFPLMGWIVGKDSSFFREIIKIKGESSTRKYCCYGSTEVLFRK